MASNLLPEDRREVEEGHGTNVFQYFLKVSQDPTNVWFDMPNGKAAGMAGVSKDGNIWMLCTPVILEYPLTFARRAKRFVDSRPEPLLWNIVDKRNTVHLKLLKFLGFKFLREIRHGPNNLTFIEFAKCVNHNKNSTLKHSKR